MSYCMTLYFKGYQKYDNSKLKGLKYGKDKSRGLSCGCTFSICQDIMKSDNLLHKQGFVDSLSQTTALAG